MAKIGLLTDRLNGGGRGPCPGVAQALKPESPRASPMEIAIAMQLGFPTCKVGGVDI